MKIASAWVSPYAVSLALLLTGCAAAHDQLAPAVAGTAVRAPAVERVASNDTKTSISLVGAEGTAVEASTGKDESVVVEEGESSDESKNTSDKKAAKKPDSKKAAKKPAAKKPAKKK